MSQDDVVVEAAAPKKHNNNDVKRLVGKEVVEPPRDINALQQGAGENASLNPKGGFEPCPHLSGGRQCACALDQKCEGPPLGKVAARYRNPILFPVSKILPKQLPTFKRKSFAGFISFAELPPTPSRASPSPGVRDDHPFKHQLA